MTSEPNTQSSRLSEIYRKLYTTFLRSFIYDVRFEKNAAELTFETVLNEFHATTRHGGPAEASAHPNTHDSRIFREDEIIVYGMADRRHLSPLTTKRLREEVDATLQTIAELFYASSTQEEAGSCPPISRLPEDLQGQVGDINSMQLESHGLSLQLTNLLGQTQTTREEFDRELEQLICNTFPVFKASRNASIDLLAATLEATLQKLNSIRESTRQSFYNHKVEQKPAASVSQAISIAHQALVEEEGVLKTETQDLDRQIQEYEALLRLVDGSSGGYQQIVTDWVKIRQETDECLKDLRRLGWTGD